MAMAEKDNEEGQKQEKEKTRRRKSFLMGISYQSKMGKLHRSFSLPSRAGPGEPRSSYTLAPPDIFPPYSLLGKKISPAVRESLDVITILSSVFKHPSIVNYLFFRLPTSLFLNNLFKFSHPLIFAFHLKSIVKNGLSQGPFPAHVVRFPHYLDIVFCYRE